MAGIDKEYFDAKFEGIEKLMRSDKENMLAYVGAVSKNATKANDALVEHEKDTSAHGGAAAERTGSSIVQWIGLAVAVVAAGASLAAIAVSLRK